MDALAWIDIETTGLVPKDGWILEVAIFVTDLNLNPIGQAYSLGSLEYRDVAGVKARTDEFVETMHTVNGLWNDLQEAWNKGTLPVSSSELDEKLYSAIQMLKEANGIDILYPAGSSVHFDTDWLGLYCPRLCSLFSHRHLDISSLKLAMLVTTGSYPKSEIDPKHRAADDIMESLDWFKNYIYPAESVVTQAAHITKIME